MVPPLVAQPRTPDPVEILRRAEELRSPRVDFAVDFTITSRSPGSTVDRRESAYTMIAQGSVRSLILTLEPRRLYGSMLLIAEGSYWLLLPRALRPLQLSARHVIGGDVAYGDLARASLTRLYRPRLDGEETVGEDACWRLELSPADELAAYPRIRAWIRQQGFQPQKLEYFGQTGALLRTATFHDYRSGELGRRAMRIEVESASGPGERTTLAFSDLRPLDASGLELEPTSLVIFRDAALAVREAEQRKARAEDLVAALATWNP